MKAENGHQVVMNLDVHTSEGVHVGKGPQTITLGDGAAFRLLEEAIVGMSEGENKSIAIPSNDAFGPRREELIVQIPRTQLPMNGAPQKGMQLVGTGNSDEEVKLVIIDVRDDVVVADGNHPLAGLDLNVSFSIEKITALKQ